MIKLNIFIIHMQENERVMDRKAETRASSISKF